MPAVHLLNPRIMSLTWDKLSSNKTVILNASTGPYSPSFPKVHWFRHHIPCTQLHYLCLVTHTRLLKFYKISASSLFPILGQRRQSTAGYLAQDLAKLSQHHYKSGSQFSTGYPKVSQQSERHSCWEWWARTASSLLSLSLQSNQGGSKYSVWFK